jgi:hypothetical protein
MIAVLGPLWFGKKPAATLKSLSPKVATTLQHPRHETSPRALELTQNAEPMRKAKVKESPMADANVVPASYQSAMARPTVARPPDLVLLAEKPTPATLLVLRVGQCVRGPSGRRATVLVSGDGLLVEQDDVRFENIDFVGRPASTGDPSDAANPAIVQLQTGRITFRGCSFTCGVAENCRTVAIRWRHPARLDNAETSLLSGRIQLTDCLFHGVEVGLDCQTAAALAVEIRNTLCVAAGPLMRLDHCPKTEEPVSLVLSQVTLRDGGPLLECRMPRGENQPGEMTIVSTQCAFSPKSGEALIRVVGAESPGRLLGAVRWSGQGSLVTPETPIGVWCEPDGRQQPLDESSLAIAGLVRSAVGFAGVVSRDPATSRLVHWQAPLQSADPPGISPNSIPRMPD